MADQTAGHGSTWRIWWGGGLIVVVIGLLLFLGRRTDESGDDTPAANPTGDNQTLGDADLDAQLRTILRGLQPDRLGFTSNASDLVNDLNLWLEDYDDPAESAAATRTDAQRADFGELPQRATTARFDARDAAHIRTAFLMRMIAERVSAKAEGSLPRALAAMEFVQLHVPLAVRSAAGPLTPFEVLLLGRGTAADRAWVFCEITRQLGIETILIAPAEAAEDGPLLVGVLVPESGVLLFDPGLGLPIPVVSDAAGVLPTQPVSLEEAMADDAPFRQFDIEGGQAYPWTSATLGTAQFLVPAPAEYSASRMRAVQSALGQDALATLYDPVAPEQGPSIADRLRSTVPAFAAQPISLWDYPEANAQAFFTEDGESSDAWQTQLDKLRGPRIVEHISGGDAPDITRYVDAPTQLIEVRINHLLGKVTESLRQYGSMRGADPKISPVNVVIRTDAVYWITVCQYELERFDAAAATARLALKSNQDDVRSRPISSLLGLCQARTERWMDAAATAAGLSASQPDAREAYLSRRWMAMAGQTDDTPASNDAAMSGDAATPSAAAAPASSEPP